MSTPAGGFEYTGKASTKPVTIVSPELFLWSLGEKTEEKDFGTKTRQIFVKYKRFRQLKVIETILSQSLVLDPGEC